MTGAGAVPVSHAEITTQLHADTGLMCCTMGCWLVGCVLVFQQVTFGFLTFTQHFSVSNIWFQTVIQTVTVILGDAVPGFSHQNSESWKSHGQEVPQHIIWPSLLVCTCASN